MQNVKTKTDSYISCNFSNFRKKIDSKFGIVKGPISQSVVLSYVNLHRDRAAQHFHPGETKLLTKLKVKCLALVNIHVEVLFQFSHLWDV